MKIELVTCHTVLISMLMMPEKFSRAIASYKATAPNVDHEGVIGYLEVSVEFEVRDLEAFTALYRDAYLYPTERAEWYHFIRNGIDKFNPGEYNG